MGKIEHTFIKSRPTTEIVVTSKTSTRKIISVRYIHTLQNNPYKHEGATFETLLGYACFSIIKTRFPD